MSANIERLLLAVAEIDDTEGRLRKAVALNLLGFGPDLGSLSRRERHRLCTALSDCNKAISAAALLQEDEA